MPSHLVERWEREGYAALTRSARAGGRKAAALRRKQEESRSAVEKTKPVDNDYARVQGKLVEPVKYQLPFKGQLSLDLEQPAEQRPARGAWWKNL